MIIIELIQNSGIAVVFKPNIHQKFEVIDPQIPKEKIRVLINLLLYYVRFENKAMSQC